ncbi:hypothetical protein BpHYR1_013816 [Brachionus plicatilis]|uniref:Uncharacterized protein n=1 Tax=Brachionus plicatilis TaxID=10195 RepID=A0A3M7SX78_BRAPC|nr:hypothetical protein BpHYR1_013816 [Brachionus plicatilis]
MSVYKKLRKISTIKASKSRIQSVFMALAPFSRLSELNILKKTSLRLDKISLCTLNSLKFWSGSVLISICSARRTGA